MNINVEATIEEARKWLRSNIGLCLCGHGESCSVCTRPDSVRFLEEKFRKIAGSYCGTAAYPHRVGYGRVCDYCGHYVSIKTVDFVE